MQLSRAFARKGHNVLHTYTAELQTPRGALLKQNDDSPNLSIYGITLTKPFNRYSLTKRFAQERELGRALQYRAMEFQPDIIISANTPLAAQKTLLSTARQLKAGFVFWLQDLLGVGIKRNLNKKLPFIGNAIGSYFIHLEKSILAESDAVVAITNDFVPILIQAGIAKEKIHVIHNWAPLDEIPCHAKSSPWSRKYNLDQVFCFLYSGTLGMKHNPALLVELSQAFRTNKNVRIVVVTEGLGSEYLRTKKEALKLDNLLLLPFQPFKELPMMLASADVLVAILEPDASIFSVPSKVLTYLCAQRPLLLSVPWENLAARTVKDARAGIVVQPEDISGFLQAAEKLAGDAQLRKTLAENGYKFAVSEFDILSITKRFDKILENLKSPAGYFCKDQNCAPAQPPQAKVPRGNVG
jgi:colanic acid biosynthesis glycosyl transferase WcaI